MATVSMAASFPTTTSLKLRHLNRRSLGSNTIRASSASVNGAITCEGVKLTEGLGNLPKVILTSSHGSEAEIYLFGACVTSWKVPNGKDLLFVRPDAVFNGQKPISGGIPHCFPQFGPGAMQQIPSYPLRDEEPIIRVLASNKVLSATEICGNSEKNLNWSLVESESVGGKPVVTFELKDDSYSRSMWDFTFQALYKVILDSTSLSTELTVTNTDKKAFSFSTALHTYFRASVTGAAVGGLKGCKTLNKDPDPKNPLEGIEERDMVTFPGFVDCVYLDAPNELSLENGLGDKILIKNTNWSDAVLWNPHLTMEACYKDFVCVENAKIKEVQLEPEQSWTATQQLTVT